MSQLWICLVLFCIPTLPTQALNTTTSTTDPQAQDWFVLDRIVFDFGQRIITAE